MEESRFFFEMKGFRAVRTQFVLSRTPAPGESKTSPKRTSRRAVLRPQMLHCIEERREYNADGVK